MYFLLQYIYLTAAVAFQINILHTQHTNWHYEGGYSTYTRLYDACVSACEIRSPLRVSFYLTFEEKGVENIQSKPEHILLINKGLALNHVTSCLSINHKVF